MSAQARAEQITYPNAKERLARLSEMNRQNSPHPLDSYLLGYLSPHISDEVWDSGLRAAARSMEALTREGGR